MVVEVKEEKRKSWIRTRRKGGGCKGREREGVRD